MYIYDMYSEHKYKDTFEDLAAMIDAGFRQTATQDDLIAAQHRLGSVEKRLAKLEKVLSSLLLLGSDRFEGEADIWKTK